MNKKLMMVALLLGGLTLGACVDDNESASVTAVRDAKAEQLKAAAALDKAKAEAELIEANAYAEYQKAQAAYYQAQADQKQFDLQKAKEDYALNLEKTKLQAQKDLQDLKDQLASQAYNNWTNVSWNYNSALNDLITYQYNLIDKKAQLAKLEAGVISAEKQDVYNQLYYSNQIAQAEAKLTVLKDEAYAGIDNEELLAKAAAKQKEADLAKAAFAKDPTCAALLATVEPIKEARKALDEQGELFEAVFNYRIVDWNTDYPTQWYNEYTAVAYNTTGTLDYSTPHKGVYIKEADKLAKDRSYATDVKTAAAALGKADDAKTATTAYGALAAANDALKTANAMPETTDAEKTAKRTAIERAEDQVANAKDALRTTQKTYDDAVAAQKEYQDAVAAFSADAYNKAAEAFVAACEAQEEAKEAWNEAKKSVDKVQAEANALYYLAYNSATDVKEQIAILEKDIAEYKESMEVSSYNSQNATAQLERLKVDIEVLEEKIDAQKKAVALAKAALDAANADDSEGEAEEA